MRVEFRGWKYTFECFGEIWFPSANYSTQKLNEDDGKKEKLDVSQHELKF